MRAVSKAFQSLCLLNRSKLVQLRSYNTSPLLYKVPKALFSSKPTTENPDWKMNEYVRVSDSTLETISETYEEMGDPIIIEVNYGNGILKIECKGEKTFVLNRQATNKQIWYSSPVSGPARYNYNFEDNQWKNKDEKVLEEVLEADMNVLRSKA